MTALEPGGPPAAADVPRRNWAGNVRYAAREFHRPDTIDDLRRLVAGSTRVRAVGSGHSFNRLGDTDGDLVSLAGLPPTIEVDRERAAGHRRRRDALRRRRRNTCTPRGTRWRTSPRCRTSRWPARWPPPPTAPARRNGNLATAVAALETGHRRRRPAARATATTTTFAGMVVGLGALGVVTRLTLDVVPTFDLRQYVRLRPATARRWTRRSARRTASASSPTGVRHGCDQVWRKQPADQPPPEPDWLGTTAADEPTAPGARDARGATAPRSSACRGRGTSGCRTSGSASPRAAATSCSPSTTCPATAAAEALAALAEVARPDRAGAAGLRAAYGRGGRAVAQPELPARQPRRALHLGRRRRRGAAGAGRGRGTRWPRSRPARTGARSSSPTRGPWPPATRGTPTSSALLTDLDPNGQVPHRPPGPLLPPLSLSRHSFASVIMRSGRGGCFAGLLG